MDYYLIAIWIAIFVGWFIYKKLTKNFDFFDKRGIRYEKPVIIFGNMFKLLMQKENFIDLLDRMYSKFKNDQ